MVYIELDDGQSGYDVITEYIKRYWKHHIADAVVFHIGISYDGLYYRHSNQIAEPMGFNDIEFLNDWWEGERYIELYGIQSLDELDIFGGIYDLQ